MSQFHDLMRQQQAQMLQGIQREWSGSVDTSYGIGSLLGGSIQPNQLRYHLVQTYKGEGFIVAATDGSNYSEEVKDLEAAQDKAAQMLDKHGAVVIYEAIAIVRPKKDIVARFTKRGAELSAGKSAASLSSGEVIESTKP